MKKKIIRFFNNNPGVGFKNKEIAKRLNIKSLEDYSLLKEALHKLYEEEFLSKKGKRYKLNALPDSNRLSGTLKIHSEGYGFVSSSKKKLGDIYIAGRNIGPAFDGDKVEVVLFAKQKGKSLAGQIVKVLKRKRKEILGTLHKAKSFYIVNPDDSYIHRDIYVDETNLNNAKENDKVIVGNIVWNSSMLNPEGVIVEVLGEEGTPDAEVATIAKEFNLPVKFSAKAIRETKSIELNITREDLKKRLDLRKENTLTIDPIDAKDFDDALSIKQLENGNLKLGVHIADVSHYVQKDSALDKQANLRGNSVYLVGKVISMLPEKLSNGVCSLVPNEDRLTYSVIFEITKRGKIVKYDIAKTIIKSKRRFTYEEAQEIIETKKGDYSKEIIQLNNLARTLRKNRIKEGSIDFFTSEVKFELDEFGKPIAVTRKEIKESNMLVEEFMLLANKTVAQHRTKPKKSQRKPFVYRIHDKPEREKINEFSRFVKSLGYNFNANSFSNSKEIQHLISEVKGSEEEAVINELAIRSMAKAVYSTKNIGHFGLAFNDYTHFTSPIRRYSDLLVHRMIYLYNKNKSGAIYSLEQMNKICDHISATERIAVDAERRSVKMKQIDYLKNRIGEEFHAIVSGVTNFGIFVKITDILAEGLIKIRDLEGDFYVYDEKNYSLIGRRTRKKFRLGDKLFVKLIRADLDKLELDFIITE
jgi:ribonuclease R